MARLFRERRRRRDFPDGGGGGATKIIFLAAEVDTVQFSRPSRRRRDQEIFPRYQGGDRATFRTNAETARLFRLRRRRHDFPDKAGDGATKIIFLAVEVDTVQLSRTKWRRRDFSDQDQNGDGATFQNKAETTRLHFGLKLANFVIVK